MRARSTYLAWANERYGKVRFDLATSGMPAPPPAVLGEFTPESLTLPAAWSEVRAAVARYNDVPVGEAVVALGTTHALWLACMALLEPGDRLLVEDPGYEPLVRIGESAGAEVARFSRPAAAGFALDPDLVARAMTPRTRAVVLSSPHNPSGARASDAALRSLASALAPSGATLIVDEVYAPFDGFVDADGVFRGSARKLGPNVACVSSLSKCYGLGAQRIGWLLAVPEVIARAEQAITISAGALPVSHAAIALRALQRIAPLAGISRAHLTGKRERVAQWAASLGLGWSTPTSGLFGFVHLPGHGDLTDFIERTARDSEVLVAPGSFFGEPEGFRLAWSARPEILDEGLARLGAALTALMRARLP